MTLALTEELQPHWGTLAPAPGAAPGPREQEEEEKVIINPGPSFLSLSFYLCGTGPKPKLLAGDISISFFLVGSLDGISFH